MNFFKQTIKQAREVKIQLEKGQDIKHTFLKTIEIEQ